MVTIMEKEERQDENKKTLQEEKNCCEPVPVVELLLWTVVKSIIGWFVIKIIEPIWNYLVRLIVRLVKGKRDEE